MSFKQISGERLDDALKRQAVWEPPHGFARSVVANVPAIARQWPATEPRRGVTLLHAIASGLATATAAYLVGSLLTWGAPLTIDDATRMADRYVMFVELATSTLMAHATVVAWVSAAVALSITATVTRRELQL